MGNSIELGLRSSVVAVRLGDALGLDDRALSAVYYVALLRSAGCTADSAITAEVFGDEIAARIWLNRMDRGQPAEMLLALVRRVGAGEPVHRRARMLGNALATLPELPQIEASHCEVAQLLATKLGLGPAVHNALGQVFERWDGRGLPRHLKKESITLAARVVSLAHDATLYFRLGGVDAAVGVVRKRARGSYDPGICECFCGAASQILSGVDQGSAWDQALAAESSPWIQLSDDQLDSATRAIGEFADLVIPHLVVHSTGVGELAAAAARTWSLPSEDVVALRRAGYLHDVGRVGVTTAIWAKPGPLDDQEWERVRLHSYYTERILIRPRVLAELGALAALHHERLDGSGYHRGLPASLLSPAARILAAADVYHASTEARPYRAARSADAAADEVRGEVRAGRLDGHAVNAVLAAAGHRIGRRRHEWPNGLSEREVEVLRLVARGLSNREMGEKLVISGSTVHHHVRHIYDKIGVSTRAAATLYAMQHDLLSDTLLPDI